MTADDFGVSDGVNRAVLEAHDAGVLSAAALVSRGEGTGEALDLARSTPTLDVGFHFVLAVGQPTADPALVPTLVRPDGRFLSRDDLLRGAVVGRIAMSDVATEFDRQMDVLLAGGVMPAFINGDQHVHVLPVVRDVVAARAAALNLPVRLPGERSLWLGGATIPPVNLLPRMGKKALLAVLCRQFRGLAARMRLRTNDWFLSPFGIIPRPDFTADGLLALLAHARPGVTEYMAHPAHADRALRAFWVDGDESGPDREAELGALCDPRVHMALSNGSLVLTRWSEL